MSDAASYLGILSGIIILALGLLMFRRPIFVRIVSSFLWQRNFYKLLIIGCFILATTIISFALSSNEFLANQTRQNIKNQNGDNTGVIFNYDSKQYYETDKLNLIYSQVSDEFDRFLPILQTQTKIKDKDILLMSFETKAAKSYSNELSQYDDEVFNLKPKEVILSKEVANTLNLKESNEFKILDREFVVKKIIDDNGVVGFDFSIESKLNHPIGSIVLNRADLVKLIPELKTNESISLNNAILVKRNGTYSRTEVEIKVNEQLQKIDRNLYFEETSQYISKKEFGSTDGLNIGQLILIYGGIILVPIIVLIFYAIEKLKYKRFEALNSLRIIGVSRNDISSTLLLESSVYAFLAAILGTIIGVGLSYLLLTTNVTNFFPQITSGSLSIPVVIITLSISWIILSLISTITSIQYGDFNASISNSFVKNSYKTFSFRNHTSTYLLILAGFVMIYYGLGSYLASKELNTFLSYFGFDILLLSLTSLATKIWPLSKRGLWSLTSVILIGVVSYNWFSSSPVYNQLEVLRFYDSIKLILAVSILFLINLGQISNLLNLVFGRIKKFKLYSYLSLNLFSTNFESNLFFTSIFTILLILIAFLPIVKDVTKTLSQNATSQYDVIVIDKLGRENIDSNLAEFADSIEKTEKLNYGYIYLGGYKYNDLSGFDSKTSTYDGEKDFTDNVSTFNSNFINDYAIKSDDNFKDKISTIWNDNQYAIVGRNYLSESNADNLHPAIKIGDKIKAQFSNGVIIERTVAGIIEKRKNSENSISLGNSSALNGVFLSEKDYSELRSNQNVNISSAFAFKLNSNVNKVEFVNKLNQSLRDKYISEISLVRNSLDETFGFLNNLVDFLFSSIAVVLIIMMAIFLMVLRDLNNEKNSSFNKYSVITISLFSLMSLIFSSILAFTISNSLWENTKTLIFEDIVKYNISIDLKNYLFVVSILLIVTIGMSIFINSKRNEKAKN